MRKILLLLMLILGLAAARPVPALTARVNDTAGLLTAGERQELENLLAAYEAGTAGQMVLLTIDSLEGESLESYSMQVVEQWQPGQKNRDNGVLLLIVKADRRARIEVGYGLEPVLTDVFCGQALDQFLLPAFREGAYYAGIYRTLTALMDRTGFGPEGAAAPAVSAGYALSPGQEILLPLVLFFAVFLGLSRQNFLFKGLWGGVFLILAAFGVLRLDFSFLLLLLLLALGWPFSLALLGLFWIIRFWGLSGGGIHGRTYGGRGMGGGFRGGGGRFGGGGASRGW
ncbi:MAG: TPM domain-containing protein [Candidatus Margulisbacteria bacterium]|jgi:uncharacterized protein|nr:TPM domain-containing protein [Candidatus Margulisiibacteriota bacterium]